MNSISRFLLIINPNSGGGKSLDLAEICIDFLHLHAFGYSSYSTVKPNDLDGIQKSIIEYQPDAIIIVGGDGTIKEVINVPEARALPLLLVPGGTGNDYSQVLFADKTLWDILKSLQSPNIREVDVGICNDSYFLNGVGIGFDGSIAAQTNQGKTTFLYNAWKYWIAIFRNILFYKSSQLRVEFGAQVIENKIFMISVANGKAYGGGFKVSPESIIDDGKYNLLIINALHPIIRLFEIPILQNGKHLKKSYVQHFCLDNDITVSGSKPIFAHLDGEVMIAEKFNIRMGGKLKVFRTVH
jgi:diacylglycerol kinase (ATP)